MILLNDGILYAISLYDNLCQEIRFRSHAFTSNEYNIENIEQTFTIRIHSIEIEIHEILLIHHNSFKLQIACEYFIDIRFAFVIIITAVIYILYI